MTTSPLKTHLQILLLLSLCAFLLPIPKIAKAQGKSDVSLSAEIGFEGYCREGAWNPVRVEVSNKGADLTGQVQVVQDNSMGGQTIYAQEISLPNTSRKNLTIYTFVETYSSGLAVQYLSGSSVITKTPLQMHCMRKEDYLIGVIADRTTPFNLLNTLTPGQSAFIAQISPANLPENAASLSIINILVVSGIDTGVLTPAQQSALAGWVNQGGQLLVFGGPEWQKTAAGLRSLLPVEIQGAETRTVSDDFAQFDKTSPPMAGEMVFSHVTPKAGAKILSGTPETPLIISQAYGPGRVIYLPFDPGLEPFSKWAGKEAFYRAILTGAPSRPVWSWGLQSVGSAYNAVSFLPGQRMPSRLLIIGFMLGYVAIVGPVNYIVVRRIKRREISWFTIPAVVLVFCAIAFGLGVLGLGNQPVLNQLYVVQSNTRSAIARVDGMIGIYSPLRSTYSIKIDPPFLLHTFPKNGQGPDTEEKSFIQGQEGGHTNRQVRIDQAGIYAMTVHGQAPAPKFDTQLSINLDNGTGTLTGEITNNSDITLKNAVLLLPVKMAAPLGDLPPGKHVPVNQRWSYRFASPGDKATVKYNEQGFYEPQYGADSGYPWYYGSQTPGDLWVSTLIGTSQSIDKAEDLQRYQLIRSLINANNFADNGTPGAIYLAGWSDTAVANTELSGRWVKKIAETLYIVQLDSELHFTAPEAVEIQPGQFTWQFLERSTNVAAQPFPNPIYKGAFSLSYIPIYSVPFQSVSKLTMAVTSPDPNAQFPVDAKFSLWDFNKGDWQEQAITNWGPYQMEDPQRFVGPLCEIRLRIENTSNNTGGSLQINQPEFDLTVQP